MAASLRRFRRRSSRRRLLLAVVALLFVSRAACDRRPAGPAPETVPAPRETSLYDVQRIVDGDTLELLAADEQPADDRAPRHFRVRLLGIDTPETVHPDKPVEPWGPEAAAFTRQFVHGRQVRLQFDRRRVDKYDRYLAYVYVGDRMLNEELVRAGLARVRTYGGDAASMARRLHAAENAARDNARGIWAHREERP